MQESGAIKGSQIMLWVLATMKKKWGPELESKNNRGQTTIINNQPKILSTEEKKAVAYNLSRFVRNS
jgi:hypothetical protein